MMLISNLKYVTVRNTLLDAYNHIWIAIITLEHVFEVITWGKVVFRVWEFTHVWPLKLDYLTKYDSCLGLTKIFWQPSPRGFMAAKLFTVARYSSKVTEVQSAKFCDSVAPPPLTPMGWIITMMFISNLRNVTVRNAQIEPNNKILIAIPTLEHVSKFVPWVKEVNHTMSDHLNPIISRTIIAIWDWPVPMDDTRRGQQFAPLGLHEEGLYRKLSRLRGVEKRFFGISHRWGF